MMKMNFKYIKDPSLWALIGLIVIISYVIIKK